MCRRRWDLVGIILIILLVVGVYLWRWNHPTTLRDRKGGILLNIELPNARATFGAAATHMLVMLAGFMHPYCLLNIESHARHPHALSFVTTRIYVYHCFSVRVLLRVFFSMSSTRTAAANDDTARDSVHRLSQHFARFHMVNDVHSKHICFLPLSHR